MAAAAASSGIWFRKCLRLHDNAALVEAVRQSGMVVPFFILDPWFDRQKIGVNRYNFLLESLRDLDEQLRSEHQSRLLVFQGRPEEVLRELFEGKGAVRLTSIFWEKDSEPYAMARDSQVATLAKECGVKAVSFSGHTLLDLEATVARKGFKPPISMKSMQTLVNSTGPISEPLGVPKIPPLQVDGFEVPSISQLYEEQPSCRGFPGGEREALRRLATVCSDADYVCNFEKPKTASTGRQGSPWEPSTTGLSPYIKFGCISVRTIWHAIARCQQGRMHTEPPQSLHGQILFRDMFYLHGLAVPNYDKNEGNAMCKPIPWGADAALLAAWEEGRTGFPFIDALMRQLKQTGWMHHLGRHAVACFLTRGDLWQSWTAGRDIFDRYLIDADWSVNNGNWLWLAGVAPFSAPYFRVYDPCPGPKSSLNADQTGEFVRHFVPELKAMPAKYIYKPWTAPIADQKKAGCIVGKDYPNPIVDHQKARDTNIARFKAAVDASKGGTLPEKFGVAAVAHGDPGPMQTKLAFTPSAGSSSCEKGTGKGSGRKGKRTESAEVKDAALECDVAQGTQRKRRWGSGPSDKAMGA